MNEQGAIHDTSDLWSYRWVSDPAVSPSGDRVAALICRFDRTMDRRQSSVVTMRLDQEQPNAVREWESIMVEQRLPQWASNGSLACVETVGGIGRLRMLESGPGGALGLLTTHDHDVVAYSWSPYSDAIVYLARQMLDPFESLPYTRSHHRYDSIDGGRPTPAQLFEWRPDRPSRQITDDLTGFREVAYFNRDTAIAVRELGPSHSHLLGELVAIDLATCSVRRLAPATMALSTPVPLAHEDAVAFIAGGEGRGANWQSRPAVHVVSVDGEHSRVLVGDCDRPSGYGRSLAAHGTGIVALRPCRGRTELWRAALDEAPSLLNAPGHVVTSVDCATGTTVWTGQWYDQGPDLYAARAAGHARVTAVNDELFAHRTVHVREQHSWAAASATTSFVAQQDPRTARRGCRVVVQLGGGPHGAQPGAHQSTWVWRHALLRAGYTLVEPNPRGSRGYGEEVLDGAVGSWGGPDADDVVAVIERARVELGVASDQMALLGSSYGGYLAAMVLGRGLRLGAACLYAPLIDLSSWLRTTDLPELVLDEFAVDADDHQELRAASPISTVNSVQTPVRLVVSEDDVRVPPSQAAQFFNRLCERNHPVVFDRYPGGSHADMTPSQVVAEAAALIDWLEDHIVASGG